MPNFFSRKKTGFIAGMVLLGASLTFVSVASAESGRAQAVFAGGCFWCLESDFDKLKGVLNAESGYGGGSAAAPTYKTYSKGGHYEVVRVSYDPSVVSYNELVEYFWRKVDPTDAGGQFCDRGKSYSTAIFVENAAEKTIALRSRQSLEQSGILPGPVVTPVLELEHFWPAEERHQNYAKKHSWRYNYYRRGCGRDKRLKSVWRKDKAHKKAS